MPLKAGVVVNNPRSLLDLNDLFPILITSMRSILSSLTYTTEILPLGSEVSRSPPLVCDSSFQWSDLPGHVPGDRRSVRVEDMDGVFSREPLPAQALQNGGADVLHSLDVSVRIWVCNNRLFFSQRMKPDMFLGVARTCTLNFRDHLAFQNSRHSHGNCDDHGAILLPLFTSK